MRGLLTEGVKILLIWNAIIFLLQQLLSGGLSFLDWDFVVRARLHGMLQLLPYSVTRLEQLFGVVPVLVWQKFFVWQLGSYMFLHGGLWHIFFNMFALWMFGTELERLWGSKRFLQYYFFTGVGAGILTVVLTPNSPIPTIGASGAIYGILLAYAYYFPQRRIFLYFLFPIPARIFVIIIGVLAFLNSMGPSGGIAHIAHLGGLVFGYLFLRGGGWLNRLRGGRRRTIDFSRRDDDWGGGR
ncbi:MAG: rhomboid family intramembrane serine protease [Candidatus Eisenbacteria bacterium]|nr:rhomboid family intramembrane serine protease [Candidatus Eisenbacteria bacterium]